MKISIALCTYNGEKFLEQQLNSYNYQTLNPQELIVCDDGSSDNTLKILHEFKLRANFEVSIFENQTALGAIKNFEKAIGLCSGDIIFLSDQDDVWVNNKVEKIYKFFQGQTECEAVFTDGKLINDSNELLNKNLWEQFGFPPEVQLKWRNGEALRDLLNNGNRITGATMAIRPSLYKRSVPFRVSKGLWHDLWLGLHAAANNSLGWIQEELILYRIHDQQQVGIGQGLSIKALQQDGKIPITLEMVLSDVKSHYTKCLEMLETLIIQYPGLDKNSFRQDALDALTWVNFRSHLPKNNLSRILSIFQNYSLYRKHSPNFIRSMLRDILQPLRVS